MRSPSAAFAEAQSQPARQPRWLLLLTQPSWGPQSSTAFATHRVVGAPMEPIYQMGPPSAVSSEINFLAGSARVGSLTVPIFGRLDDRDIMSRLWPGIRGMRAFLYQGFEGLGFGDWEIVWRGETAGAKKAGTKAGWSLISHDLLRSTKRRIAGPLELDPITMALTVMMTTGSGLNGPYDNGSLSGDRLPYAMGIDQEDIDVAEWEAMRDQLVAARRLMEVEVDHTGSTEIRPLATLSEKGESSGLSWIVSSLLVPLGLAMRIKADGRIGVVSIMPAPPHDSPDEYPIDDSDFILVAAGGRAPKLPDMETTDYLVTQGFSGSIEPTTAKAAMDISEIETLAVDGAIDNGTAEEVNGGLIATASDLKLSPFVDDVGAWKATAIESAVLRLRRHSAPQVKMTPRMQARRAANIETGDVLLVSSDHVPPLGYPDPMSHVPMRVEKVSHDAAAGFARATMRDWRENSVYPYELDENAIRHVSDETAGYESEWGFDDAELWDPMSDQAAPYAAKIPAAQTTLDAHYIVVRFVVKLFGNVGHRVRYDWGVSVGFEEVGALRVSRDVQRYRERIFLLDVAAIFRVVTVVLWAEGDRMVMSGLFNREPLRILAWQAGPITPPQVLTVTTQDTIGITHRWGADTGPPRVPPDPDIPIVCPTDAVPQEPSDR